MSQPEVAFTRKLFALVRRMHDHKSINLRMNYVLYTLTQKIFFNFADGVSPLVRLRRHRTRTGCEICIAAQLGVVNVHADKTGTETVCEKASQETLHGSL